MLSQTLGEIVAGGVDQRYYPAPNKASNILNFRYDPNGGWRNDRGWEPLVPDLLTSHVGAFTTAEINDLYAPCRFLQVVQRHQGAEEYYVQERNGELFYEFGNKNAAASNYRKITLATGRNLPRPTDPGTQAIPFGRFTLFMNGYNDMLKWWGRDKVEQFSFYQLPPSPTILPVDTTYNVGAATPNGSPANQECDGICIQFLPSDILGLGDPSPNARSTYSYKISYVTDTGSESPLSGDASVSWQVLPSSTPVTNAQTASQKKYAVILTGLDPGPTGTVARRIYRTKNKKDGISGAGDVYYFVAQVDENTSVTYVDAAPDNQLTLLAPGIEDSVVINTSYKYGAAWNGSMWIAGGEGQPTLIRYSKPGLPEQFGGFDFFDVGVRDGGHITALYPYYDFLLVFRERAIDAVFVNSQGNGFTCTTINKDIGTTATNTIKLVPGKGVMFLNKDGFWLASGGLRGGASFTVTNMSLQIEPEMATMSKNALARATAAYSDREKEYWCHYPVNGATENSRGSSYNATVEAWSFRGYNGTSESESLAFWSFSQIACDQSGYFILGTVPFKTDPAAPLTWTGYPGLGLQVWSAARQWGFDAVPTASGIDFLISVANVNVGECIWASTWYDFGDDSVKKRVLGVELESLSEGCRGGGIELEWYSDWSYEQNSAGRVAPLVGEIAYTNADQWSYVGPNPPVPAPSRPATWGTARWEEGRVTRLRWDVRTGLVSWFLFKLKTNPSNDGTPIVQISKFQINYIAGTVKTPNTKMPGSV